MKQTFIATAVLILFATSCKQNQKDSIPDLAQFVDPFIGTEGKGNLYPGATVPFGMVQLSPDDTENGELCAAYQHSFNYIHGFSHTHLSGTGIGDMTDLLLMPTVGTLHLSYDPEHMTGKGYQSLITKSTEKASPGYYSVFLDDYKINVALTATEHCGFHKYVFPKSDSAHIIIDLKYLNSQYHSDNIISSEIKFVNDSTMTGFRIVKNWVPHRYFYFAARFSKPFIHKGISRNDTLADNANLIQGKNLKAFVDFKTIENEIIYVKVGISSVSEEGALRNLDSEITNWDFNKVKDDARQYWNTELNKSYAEFDDTIVRKMFYTSLYRTMLAPVTHADIDSNYRGSDNLVHKGKHKNYHVFSLWDTFRALHPWLTITQPQRVSDMVNSMLAISDESGYLPVWHFGNGENNCMIGLNSMPVITDAYLKGIKGIDGNRALKAMLHDIYGNGRSTGADSFKHAAGAVFTKDAILYGTKLFHQYGYVPADIANVSVSRTLEYSYNCYTIYQLAHALGNDTADYFLKCSKYYKNVFDHEKNFMRAKKCNGEFRNVPFDPTKQDGGWGVGEKDGGYVEGSAWQWVWFVPQDISGLMDLLGGKDAFAKKLDAYFDPKTKGEETEEASGYIGQHAQGNEPAHHVPYLYNVAEQPWKTQRLVRALMTETYLPTADGLSGNDDCGQMSAWYVFSTLGFYPVNPSSGVYYIGSPAVKYAKINVGENKYFEIKVKNYSPKNIYIQKVWLNNTEYNKTYIAHSDIISGGILLFEMGNSPNYNWK